MEAEEIKECVEAWNDFVDALALTERAWKRVQDLGWEKGGTELQSLPPKAQKGYARHRKVKFNILLPRLVDHWRAYGGIAGMREETEIEVEDE